MLLVLVDQVDQVARQEVVAYPSLVVVAIPFLAVAEVQELREEVANLEHQVEEANLLPCQVVEEDHPFQVASVDLPYLEDPCQIHLNLAGP